jgi:hypothetical protein
VLAFWETAWRAERRILEVASAPEFRPVFALVIATLLVGSIFYRVVEGWHLFDAFYFSVVTLATIGYGDFSPVTTLGKSFTIAYIFVGVLTWAAFINAITKRSVVAGTMIDRRLELPGESAPGQSDSPPSTTIV